MGYHFLIGSASEFVLIVYKPFWLTTCPFYRRLFHVCQAFSYNELYRVSYYRPPSRTQSGLNLMPISSVNGIIEIRMALKFWTFSSEIKF